MQDGLPHEAPPVTRAVRLGRTNEEGLSPAKRRLLVFGLSGGAAAIVGLVLFWVGDGATYAKPVDQLLAQASRFSGRPVRAEGMLVHGSLVRKDMPCESRFRIEKNGVEMPVVYTQCTAPDLFKDTPGVDLEVTVEGKLLADGSFAASQIVTKCPTKYEMEQKQKRGETMPHGLSSQIP